MNPASLSVFALRDGADGAHSVHHKTRRLYMKQALRLAVAALCVTLVSLATATAQDQYTEGTVERVILVHILPGHFNAFMTDVKNNITPIWDAEKSAGLIESYGIFLNQTKASMDDWTLVSSSPTR